MITKPAQKIKIPPRRCGLTLAPPQSSIFAQTTRQKEVGEYHAILAFNDGILNILSILYR